MPFTMQSRVNLMDRRRSMPLAASRRRRSLAWRGIRVAESSRRDGKGLDRGEARTATRALKARGIRACWFIQLGYPGENWDDLCADPRPHSRGKAGRYWRLGRLSVAGYALSRAGKVSVGPSHNWRIPTIWRCCSKAPTTPNSIALVRDVLHDEVRCGRHDDCRWARLGHEGTKHRSQNPVLLATGS